MRQTDQQQGAAPATPKARKDWEPFWRIIAVLMLIVKLSTEIRTPPAEK